jgi:hypothetical protein
MGKTKKSRLLGGVTMGNKMGSMKDNTMRVKLLPVVGCVLVSLLWAAPCGAEYVDAGTTSDIDGPIADYYLEVAGTANLLDGAVVNGLLVYNGGTVNMYPGAYVDWFIYVEGGSTLNIYGGQMGLDSFIEVLAGDPAPVVTVYGKYFEVDGAPYSADEFIPQWGVGSVLTGLYENDDLVCLKFYGELPIDLVLSVPGVVDVAIDIKPGSDTNPINLKSKGLVPVAILTADGFVAATVDPQTVLLAGVEPLRWTMEDVDGDGDKDMLFHFKTEDLATVLTENSTEATLVGETTDGVSIQGTDKVQIVPSKSKK